MGRPFKNLKTKNTPTARRRWCVFLRLPKKVVPLHHKTKNNNHERVNFRY